MEQEKIIQFQEELEKVKTRSQELEDKLSYYKNNEIAMKDVLSKKNKEIKRLTLENDDLKLKNKQILNELAKTQQAVNLLRAANEDLKNKGKK